MSKGLVRNDSLARALTRRTHREIMERLNNLPAVTKTKPGARRKQEVQQIGNALGDLIVSNNEQGKGKNQLTILVAVLPVLHGRFDATCFYISGTAAPWTRIIMRLSEHAMTRLMQREINLRHEFGELWHELTAIFHSFREEYPGVEEHRDPLAIACEAPDTQIFTRRGSSRGCFLINHMRYREYTIVS